MQKLTRIYKEAETGKIKSQVILVDINQVATLRPSNRLGKEALGKGKGGHRSTITLVSGQEIDLVERFTQVEALVG